MERFSRLMRKSTAAILKVFHTKTRSHLVFTKLPDSMNFLILFPLWPCQPTQAIPVLVPVTGFLKSVSSSSSVSKSLFKPNLVSFLTTFWFPDSSSARPRQLVPNLCNNRELWEFSASFYKPPQCTYYTCTDKNLTRPLSLSNER